MDLVPWKPYTTATSAHTTTHTTANTAATAATADTTGVLWQALLLPRRPTCKLCAFRWYPVQ
jgi:hypothetical protein